MSVRRLLVVGTTPVCTDEASTHQRCAEEVSARLRGAAIEHVNDLSTVRANVTSCEAVVFVGASPPAVTDAERLLASKKHVLWAAEPGFASSDLQKLSSAAKQAGVQFGVANPDQYRPSRRLVKQRLGEKLGDFGLVRIHRWDPIAPQTINAPSGLPAPLIRDLELVCWLASQPPERVFALEPRSAAEKPTAGRTIQVHLGFATGMALIDYCNQLPAGADYQSLCVIGSSGAAYADDHQNVQLVYRGGLPQAVRSDEGFVPLVAMLQEFVDALAANRDLTATVAAWQTALAVADAVNESLQSQQAIAWEKR